MNNKQQQNKALKNINIEIQKHEKICSNSKAALSLDNEE
jgi:hypothetical protein